VQGQPVTYQVTSTPILAANVGRAELLGHLRLTATESAAAAVATTIVVLYQGVGCDNGPDVTGIKLLTSGSGLASASILGVDNTSSGCMASLSVPAVTIAPGDYIEVQGVRGRIDLSPAAIPGWDIHAALFASPAGSVLFARTIVRVSTSFSPRFATVAPQSYLACGPGPTNPTVTVGEVASAAFWQLVATFQGTASPPAPLLSPGQASNNTQVAIAVSGVPAGVALSWPDFVNATTPVTSVFPGSTALFFPRTGGPAAPYAAGSVDIPSRLERITPASAANQIYEFASADLGISATRIETFAISPVVSYSSPGAGMVTVQVRLYPGLMTEGDVTSVTSPPAASGIPRPRYNDPPTPAANLLEIRACNPVPAISGLAPTAATAGGSSFTLTVNGTGFVGGSWVRWNGSDRATTFVSSTEIRAAISAADIAAAGSATVTVFSPPPLGGESAAQLFAIHPPCTYTLSATAASHSEAAGTGSVTVTAPPGCAWTASSASAFLTVISGSSGSGNGTVGYSVAANLVAVARSGTLTIAGQTFTANRNDIGGGHLRDAWHDSAHSADPGAASRCQRRQRDLRPDHQSGGHCACADGGVEF
jgi:hypothetical protein